MMIDLWPSFFRFIYDHWSSLGTTAVAIISGLFWLGVNHPAIYADAYKILFRLLAFSGAVIIPAALTAPMIGAVISAEVEKIPPGTVPNAISMAVQHGIQRYIIQSAIVLMFCLAALGVLEFINHLAGRIERERQIDRHHDDQDHPDSLPKNVHDDYR